MENVTLKFGNGTIFCKDGKRYIHHRDEDQVAGKYYYLRVLYLIHLNFPEEVCNKYMKIIYALCCVASKKFNPKVITSLIDIEKEEGKDANGLALLMSIIYLAMIDLEQGKKTSKALGKKIVYDSCLDVLIKGVQDFTDAEKYDKKPDDEDDVFNIIKRLKEKLSKQRT